MNIDLRIPKKKHILFYSLTGSLLTTIIPVMVAIDHMREGQFLLRIIDISALFCLVSAIFYISFWLNIKWYNKPFVKLILLNIAILIGLSGLSISIHLPIWKITTHIPLIFYIRDEIVRNITIFIVSYLAAKFYIKSIENQQIKTAFSELQNENLTNQVRGLMQQINPHFFFNTLNTLSGLVQESPEKSEVFIDKLSQVFRYVLKMQENNKVLLSEELKFTEDYFYLLKMRFEDKIFLEVNIQQSGNEYVAPLCTQLLIENVIKHNRMNRQFPVTIVIEIENDYLKVCNTFYPQKNTNSTGLGLKNLNKRCELLSSKSISAEQEGNSFCVRVPLIKK
jgi:LytS/YehU family sensor histidine kinase